MNAKPVIRPGPDNGCLVPATVGKPGSGQQPVCGPNLKEALERLERQLVIETLIRTKGNQSQAARSLGITDRMMGLRVRKYGIDPRDFRAMYETDPGAFRAAANPPA